MSTLTIRPVYKALSCAFLFATTILLSGCGGGSGGNPSSASNGSGNYGNPPGVHVIPREPYLYVMQAKGIQQDGQPPLYNLFQGQPGSTPGTPLTPAQYQAAVAAEVKTNGTHSAIIGLVDNPQLNVLAVSRSLEIIPTTNGAICYVGQSTQPADAEFTFGKTSSDPTYPWSGTEIFPQKKTDIGIDVAVPALNLPSETGVGDGGLISGAVYYYFSQ